MASVMMPAAIMRNGSQVFTKPHTLKYTRQADGRYRDCVNSDVNAVLKVNLKSICGWK